MKKILFLLVLPILACQPTSLVKLLKQGEFTSTQELITVPFENKNDLIIVPVQIEGETYHFIVDTGAPSVITPEIAAKLKNTPSVKSKVKDSSNKSEDLSFVVLPEIKIGEATFKNTVAAISSFTANIHLNCLKIDGIIGANLMRHSIVQIDYANKVIRFSNEENILVENKENVFTVPFETTHQASPHISLKIAGERKNKTLLDTGFTGFISIDQKEKNKNLTLQKQNFNVKYGSTTSGLYGTKSADTTYSIWFGDFTLDTIPFTISGALVFEKNRNTTLIGNAFMNNFTTTFNWKTSNVMFAPIMKAQVMPQEFPLGLTITDGKIEIVWIRSGFEAILNGLELGDYLIELNDKIIPVLQNKEEQCAWLNALKDQTELDIIVQTKAGPKAYKIQKVDSF